MGNYILLPTSDEDFRWFYDDELRPRLVRVDRERRRLLHEFFLYFLVSGLCAALFFVGLFFAFLDVAVSGKASMPYHLVAYALLCWFLFKRWRWRLSVSEAGLRRSYKTIIVKPIASFVDRGLVFHANLALPPVYLRQSRFFPWWNDCVSEDYVQGFIGKVDVLISEVHAKEKSEDGSGAPVYHGIIASFKFNKEFPCSATIAYPVSHFKTADDRIPVLSKILSVVDSVVESLEGKDGEFQRVVMEDEEFNRHFVVYGTDQVWSRYVLSPSLMARILEFRRKAGRDIYVSFAAGQLFMGIRYDKDLFEPTLFQSLVSYERAKEHFDVIRLFFAVVKDLDLNTRIWSRK